MKQQTSATSETPVKDRMIIDFTGKIIYVGIDIHQKDYQMAKILNGVCLGNHRMAAHGDSVIRHLHSCYPEAEFKCVYESCAWGFNLQRIPSLRRIYSKASIALRFTSTYSL